jgi:small conductance mechanosensitive channel
VTGDIQNNPPAFLEPFIRERDIGKARDILMEILKAHPLVLDDPAPQVEMVEMADSSLNFVVRPWTKTEDYWTVYFEVMRSIKDEFDKSGISIPYPQQDVHLHQASN